MRASNTLNYVQSITKNRAAHVITIITTLNHDHAEQSRRLTIVCVCVCEDDECTYIIPTYAKKREYGIAMTCRMSRKMCTTTTTTNCS